jgi:transposase-like protein
MSVDPGEPTTAASAERQQRAAALAGTDEPSPPRPPLTTSEGIKLIGGLVVVCTGLLVLVAIAITAMILVEGNDVVAVAHQHSASSAVWSARTSASRSGTDGTQTAITALRDEAAKAQAFAANIPREHAEAAIAQAQSLASTGAEAVASGPRTAAQR